MGPEGPVSFLKELASCTYHEPDETNPGIPSNFFEVHFRFILQCTPKLFRHAYAPKCSMHLCFALCAKNAFPLHLILLDLLSESTRYWVPEYI
jgi:hypothetical protein